MLLLGSGGSRHQPDSAYVSQQTSDLTPSRNGYQGISPSTSSSAPNTIAPLSLLTNTPSNHPSPHNRSATNNCENSRCESPVASDQNSSNQPEDTPSKNVFDTKPKARRGRPPKPRVEGVPHKKPTVRRKRQSIPETLPPLSVDTQLNPPFETGGLKMRFRRDFTVEDPVMGKKSRKKSSKQSSTPVFRIVEAWCDADAPGSMATKACSASPSVSTLVSGGFQVGDIVWAKLAGYPYWPSRISALWSRSSPHQSDTKNPYDSSLAVEFTPADPLLAHGFTAQVEWFAWNQCSYLSCAKLFPFQKHFDKLYNARTRVKGYNEAVEMAKNFIQNDLSASLNPELDLGSTYISPSALSPSITEVIHTTSQSVCPLDLSRGFSCFTPVQMPPAGNYNSNNGINVNQISHLNVPHNNPADFLQNPPPHRAFCEQPWAPLPQLDPRSLAEISDVPTFSEDEDDVNESVANSLKSLLGTIDTRLPDRKDNVCN